MIQTSFSAIKAAMCQWLMPLPPYLYCFAISSRPAYFLVIVLVADAIAAAAADYVRDCSIRTRPAIESGERRRAPYAIGRVSVRPSNFIAPLKFIKIHRAHACHVLNR